MVSYVVYTVLICTLLTLVFVNFRLKHERSLAVHLRRHKQSVQTCPVCQKQIKNKHSLNNHMKNVHNDQIFKCAVCEKVLKTRIALKVCPNIQVSNKHTNYYRLFVKGAHGTAYWSSTVHVSVLSTNVQLCS